MITLPRYRAILEGKKESKYLMCKNIPLEFSTDDDLSVLWRKHTRLGDYYKKKNTSSLFDLKMVIAEKILQKCHLCERRCESNRKKNKGVCGVSQTGIASEFLHYGEEPILVPSYTIFFSGCTFECVFCQNWDISQVGCGIHIDPEKLARKIDLSLGINVNWVGGDPTPHLYYIFQVLTHCTRNIPQVWNSNMYCSLETMRLLNNVIDVYLTDFKFGNDKCAKRLSNVDNYWRIIRRNHLIAHKQGEIIVRHLVLPNHTNCCSRPILEWLAKNIPSAVINIMAQYRPCYKANNYNDIARSIYSEEYQAVLHHGKELGLNLI